MIIGRPSFVSANGLKKATPLPHPRGLPFEIQGGGGGSELFKKNDWAPIFIKKTVGLDHLNHLNKK